MRQINFYSFHRGIDNHRFDHNNSINLINELSKKFKVVRYELKGDELYQSYFIELPLINGKCNHYWGEDGDLFVRVSNSGVSCTGKIGYAVQWHLYHDRLTETPEHIEMYRALLENTEYKRCKNGIKKS